MGQLHNPAMLRNLAFALSIIALAWPLGARAETQRFSVQDFSRIRVAGPYRVLVSQQRSTSVEATGSRAALDALHIEAHDGTLIIRPDQTAASGWKNQQGLGPVEVVVRAPLVRSGQVDGSGSLEIQRLEGLQTLLTLQGSGVISVDQVAADRLELVLLGSGDITIRGVAKQVQVTARGSGVVSAKSLAADDLSIVWEGSGDGRFRAHRSARISASGSGTVTIEGPASCQVQNSGSGSVSCAR